MNIPLQTPDAPARDAADSLAHASGLCQTAVTLADARRRCEREAAHGVCDTGRYRCRYYVWGEGPPLVCIPGLCDDRLSFVMPLALLSEHFRCVAYDLPTGTGDGARLSGYRHEDYAADLLALLDHLQLARAYVLGSSFGATIALRAVHDRPERLPRAVVQGGFAQRPLAWAEILLASLARYWPGPMRRLPFRTALLKQSHQGAFAVREPEVWEYFLERCGSPPMAAVAHRALVLNRLDLRWLLPAIRQPVLLVCGDCDPLVNKACEETLVHGLPNATRVELTGCGHMPIFTHPEALAEVAYRFLTPLPCATPLDACANM
jgi:pimeloyl-ACP methyl ester carboxylesterase